MKIRIVSPGKIKEKWLAAGIDEYKKRISKYASVEIIEVPDSPDTIPVDRALAKEGEAILSKIGPSDVVWAADLHGDLLTSEEFSKKMISDIEKGGSVLTLVIGGSNGLDPSVVKRADRRVAFGNITMTHMMTRLILLEQVYRGFKIANGEKYHK
ncbi:MAG: 23S rRNA (pseudouridine(1915)-N(3))-methyltransferase RlmH [Clostridiales bacterium]|nr:23S rRNA (pseudouridine(1915)-N(3))-methyltransferase RlmH [Clostridiales bacterium]